MLKTIFTDRTIAMYRDIRLIWTVLSWRSKLTKACGGKEYPGEKVGHFQNEDGFQKMKDELTSWLAG
jgi:hypothetical protein